MSDEPKHVPTSGRDLTLTLAGLLERIEGGDVAAETNLRNLLNIIGGDKETRQWWEEKCPKALLAARVAFVKLGSAEALKIIDQQLARERLALDRRKVKADKDEAGVDIYLPDWAQPPGGMTDGETAEAKESDGAAEGDELGASEAGSAEG